MSGKFHASLISPSFESFPRAQRPMSQSARWKPAAETKFVWRDAAAAGVHPAGATAGGGRLLRPGSEVAAAGGDGVGRQRLGRRATLGAAAADGAGADGGGALPGEDAHHRLHRWRVVGWSGCGLFGWCLNDCGAWRYSRGWRVSQGLVWSSGLDTVLQTGYQQKCPQ